MLFKTIFVISVFLAVTAVTADNPIERWARAVGGRDKVAAIKSIYREATIEYGGYEGTLKVWHTADGKYRKEEQILPIHWSKHLTAPTVS